MRTLFLLLLGLLGLLGSPMLWAQVPHLTGTLDISLQKEVITCDLTVHMPEATRVWGLNRYTRGLQVRGPDGEGVPVQQMRKAGRWDEDVYRLEGEVPETLRFQYRVPNTLLARLISTRQDWKGNIAWVEGTVRAAEQANWYPIPYDSTREGWQKKVTYSIRVRCADCTTVYLGGAPPQPGPEALLVEDRPVKLMLFAGGYTVDSVAGLYFLNTSLSQGQKQALSGAVRDVEGYLEGRLGIPYGISPVVVQTQPTDPNRNWMYNSYPTITFIRTGNALAGYFLNDSSTALRGWTMRGVYHELAHYYLGTAREFSGPLYWAFLEGVNEYMALLTTQALHPEEEGYQETLEKYLRAVEGKTFVSLPEVSEASQVGGSYRYRYVPLLLCALQAEVGEAQMWQWLRTVIQSDPTRAADYALLRGTLIESGMAEATVQAWEKTYVHSANAHAALRARLMPEEAE